MLHTRMRLSRLMSFLLLIAAFIFIPGQGIYSQYSGLLVHPGTIHYQQAAEDSRSIVDISTGHSDVHARILSKTKIKSTAKKISAFQTSAGLYTCTALFSSIPLLKAFSGITKPAYYLFLFRYTLF